MHWICVFLYFDPVISNEEYVLYALNREWQSGSEIRKKIHALGYKISIGVLYNILDRLAEQCVIEEKVEQITGKSHRKEKYVFKCTANICKFLIA